MNNQKLIYKENNIKDLKTLNIFLKERGLNEIENKQYSLNKKLIGYKIPKQMYKPIVRLDTNKIIKIDYNRVIELFFKRFNKLNNDLIKNKIKNLNDTSYIIVDFLNNELILNLNSLIVIERDKYYKRVIEINKTISLKVV